MARPGVPGGSGAVLDLPCGETHAVVTDAHPLGRFVPESVVDVLRETVETADDFEAFTTAHAMGMVLEEFPDRVVAADVSDDGDVGYALVWISAFDDRRLHEIVVELLVELMEHAVSHADEDGTATAFERQMHEFDVEAFVEEYRRERDFESEFDTAI